ncbi:MAG: hypothetical protein ACE5I7_08615 [Candidatus Binatia bacterium]
MRRQRGLLGLMGLAALVGLGLAQPSAAVVTTEQSASILVFPKVIADGTRDTIIQITNTSNNIRHAHCFYVDGALLDPTQPPGAANPPRWTEVDFDIWFTKQQPTHWVVSTGRLDNPLDAGCRGSTSCDARTTGGPNADCCDAGLDPGRIPPVVPGFTGELKCIEVDAGGFPIGGNALKGEATLEVRDPDFFQRNRGDVSKYNAIGLKGFDTNNLDGTLCLGGDVSAQCPTGAEYEACPSKWLLDHPSVGAPDPVVDQQSFCSAPPCSRVDTSLTVVPCTQNFEAQNPQVVTLQFEIFNEFEQRLSASTSFQCWASFDLADVGLGVFTESVVGGDIVQTVMRSARGTPGGVMAVIEESHTDTVNDRTATAAQNVHTGFEDQTVSDIITIPAEQIQVQ